MCIDNGFRVRGPILEGSQSLTKSHGLMSHETFHFTFVLECMGLHVGKFESKYDPVGFPLEMGSLLIQSSHDLFIINNISESNTKCNKPHWIVLLGLE